MIQRPLYMDRIRPFIGNELIKVLTGIRRSGKSVMLDLVRNELLASGISPGNIISYNFEQMKNIRLCNASALYEELQTKIAALPGKTYLFFDEIQEVDSWEKCINSCRTDFDCDIYITGSNARLLSGELASYLAGRYTEFEIFPFSFREYLSSVRQKRPDVSEAAAFKKFLADGGMPFTLNLNGNSDACLQYLKDVYNSVVLKDVVRRNNIRDVDLLERLITYMLSGVGHAFSATSLSKYLKSENRKISHETLLNYVKACTDAFLLYKIRREDLRGKQILSINEKYYAADHGLREAVYGNGTRDIDQVLENIVCMELLRRNYGVTVGKNGGREIDFVATRGKDKIYVQVSYLLATEETRQREFGAFEGIADNFPKYVVSMDDVDFSRDGIRHRNIRAFLLADDFG